jgi:hypothetical protein
LAAGFHALTRVKKRLKRLIHRQPQNGACTPLRVTTKTLRANSYAPPANEHCDNAVFTSGESARKQKEYGVLKILISATIVTLTLATGAHALPALPLSDAVLKGHSNSDLVEQVQYHRPPQRAHRQYRPGGRYRTAPRGWHRYGARPSNWQRRGCVIVGPVWFGP